MLSRTRVSCPVNAEQGMTFLPANDATGHSFLPGKNGGVHDLVSCQPSSSDPPKSRKPPSTSNLWRSCTLPSTSVLLKISHVFVYLGPTEYLDPLGSSSATKYLGPLGISSAYAYLGPIPRDPSYPLLGSLTQTRLELLTLQIWKVRRSSRAGPIRTCNLESTAVKH